MNGYFLAFEIATLALTGFCVADALKRGAMQVLKIVSGVAFGLLLEWATIHQLHAYSYGRFAMMLAGEVPVAIGLGWGVIIYSVSLFTDSVRMPPAFRPVLDALLALNIDLAMDAVAIRLGMWDWGIPLDSEYFGVRWGNFWAWFWVVFFFSAAWRFFSARRSRALRALTPLLSVAIGTAGVLATNLFITVAVPLSWVPYVVPGFILAALALVLFLKPAHLPGAIPLPALVVPLVFHLCFLIAGLVSGALLDPPILLAVSLAMLAAALWLHRRGWAALRKGGDQ